MNIEFIAFESLGVRSMSTFVETKDLRIYIDPGISLAPRRYGLPPHKKEIDRLNELAKKIYERAKESDIIIITHYHFDHHDRGKRIPLDIYDRKIVYIKDPVNNINTSQRIRASIFIKLIKERVKSIEIADNNKLRVGSTEIIFSPAVPHGTDPRLGYVVQVYIRDKDQNFLYTSDIEGAPLNEHLEWILRHKPEILLIDGPLTYMLGYKLSYEDLNKSIANMSSIIERISPDIMIIEHHLLRDRDYREKIREIFNKAEEFNVKIYTAAEYMGLENIFLEAYRDVLYGKTVSKENEDVENYEDP